MHGPGPRRKGEAICSNFTMLLHKTSKIDTFSKSDGKLLIPFTGSAAFAATKTATFDVTMRVVTDCTIAATGTDFGQSGITAAISGRSNINVTCTNTTPHNVGLDARTAGVRSDI